MPLNLDDLGMALYAAENQNERLAQQVIALKKTLLKARLELTSGKYNRIKDLVLANEIDEVLNRPTEDYGV